MKDFEKQMEELERQMNEMGEKLSKLYNEKYAKKFEDFGKKISKAFSIDADLQDNEEDSGKSDIEKILPYLDDDSLHELVVSFIDGDSQVDMKKVLVYLEDEDIALLVKKLGECDGEEFNGLTVEDLLPYADEEDVDVLFMKRVRAGVMDKRLMSYVSDECWHELVKEYCNDENSKLNIDEVLPYLDEDDIKLLFKTYLKRQKKSV